MIEREKVVRFYEIGIQTRKDIIERIVSGLKEASGATGDEDIILPCICKVDIIDYSTGCPWIIPFPVYKVTRNVEGSLLVADERGNVHLASDLSIYSWERIIRKTEIYERKKKKSN